MENLHISLDIHISSAGLCCVVLPYVVLILYINDLERYPRPDRKKKMTRATLTFWLIDMEMVRDASFSHRLHLCMNINHEIGNAMAK